VQIRLELREMGQQEEDMIVFSFWPDVIMIKEIGDPLTVARYLGFDRKELNARIIMAQGRQNTNYAINLYACHPFFMQGFATMTNGENTAFVPIREYLMSRGVPGYTGYQSDSEVFTHILHYTCASWGWAWKPTSTCHHPFAGPHAMEGHPDGAFLKQLKHSCRRLIIDGPNCVIGCLPDHTLFMTQDRKKLRPGVVGGKPGMLGLFLGDLRPGRRHSGPRQKKGFSTHASGHDHRRPDRQEIEICSQTAPLHHPH
jgi:glutamate synthase domain-containing protein 1